MNIKKFFVGMCLVLGLGVLFGCGGGSSQFPLPDSVENFTEL